jgi:hypothetical protein
MRFHKYRTNSNAYFKKGFFDFYKYYREGGRYHNLLVSGYYDSQTWGALQKCWIGYIIALNKYEYDNEIKYARRIQNLQKELGLEVENFKCLEGLDEGDIKAISENRV